MERLKAVPGLTGLWQVSGRSSVSFEEMVQEMMKTDLELAKRDDLVEREGVRRSRRAVAEATVKMDQETLDALLGSMKDSFPMFRRYFQSKAAKLGKKKLPWWDLFAPVGTVELEYSWEEARGYVIDQFGTFSGELADFALATALGILVAPENL